MAKTAATTLLWLMAMVGTARADLALDPRPDAHARLPHPVGVHQHDGVFLRLMLGPGLGFASYTEPVAERRVAVELRGAGALGAIALGGRVYRDLVLHAEFGWHALVRPHVQLDGRDVQRKQVRDLAAMLGVGVTQYLGASNLFVSAGVGLPLIVEDRAGRRVVQTQPGFGAQASFGKEWWLSEQWGVGCALRLSYAAGDAELAQEVTRVRTGLAGLVLSASFG